MPSQNDIKLGELRKSLHSRYEALVETYSQLSIEVRRNALVSMTEERFYCAPILQCRPTTSSLNMAWRRELVGGDKIYEDVTGSKNDRNELCPLWTSFFDDVYQADQLHGCDIPGKYDEATYNQISGLLSQASKKAEWVEKMIDRIVRSAKHYVSRIPLATEQTIDQGWNNLCLEVIEGRPLPAVVARMHAREAKYNPRTVNCRGLDIDGEDSVRYFFGFRPVPFAVNTHVVIAPPCFAWVFTYYHADGRFDYRHETISSLAPSELPSMSTRK